MTPSKHSQSRSSFESIRKQAKKLLRELTAGNPAAIARVHAQLPVANLPVSLRDTQLVIARELGFAGWQSLREAILLREGKGLEWAASEAERAIHNNNQERLSHLIGEYPALLSWRGDFGESLLGAATGSFGDSGDPYREQMFTRLECAELLLDSGAVPDPSVWEGAIRSRAKGVLHLLSHRGLLPRSLDVLAATGDSNGIQENLARTNDSAEVEQAFLIACRFDQREIASLLLDRCIELDSTLGSKMENWRGRTEFIDYLIEHPQSFGSPWQTPVHSIVGEMLLAEPLDPFPKVGR